jgi:hypothetical protein
VRKSERKARFKGVPFVASSISAGHVAPRLTSRLADSAHDRDDPFLILLTETGSTWKTETVFEEAFRHRPAIHRTVGEHGLEV